MEKPGRFKVQFGICESCFKHLSNQEDVLTDVFFDICLYFSCTGEVIPFHVLEEKLPHVDSVILRLETEKFISTHETEHGIFVKPHVCGKHDSISIYCANRFLNCSKKVLEHKYNE